MLLPRHDFRFILPGITIFCCMIVIQIIICSVNVNAATYFVDGAGINDSGDGSPKAPKKYIQSGLDLMNPDGGDTLIIANGTYTHAKDRISYRHVPSGNRYSTIRAETDWGVTVSYPFTLGNDHNATNYIKIIGIRFDSPGGRVGGSLYVGHHAKFQRCAFINSTARDWGSNLGIGVRKNPVTQYVLIEDCYAYGKGGRYKFQTQTAKKVIFRRVVARCDGGWAPSKKRSRLPHAIFMTYNSEDILWQNCIAVDSELDYKNWCGAFYMANKSGRSWPVQTKNITWTGNIIVKVRGHAFHMDLDTNSRNLKFENNSILYGTHPGYGYFIYKHDPGALIRNTNIFYADRGIRENFQNLTVTAKNFIVINSIRENVSGGVDKSFFSSWKKRHAVDGSTFTDNPFKSGLKYPVRIEPNSALKTAGFEGSRIGAQITKKIGVGGSLWGEEGYNTTTDQDLWPFPNEAQIRADMRTEPSIGTRGFCDSGQTLTKYIWEYLGNSIPAEIYNRTDSK